MAASDIDQKRHFFLKKNGTKNFMNPHAIPFLSVLHQRKTCHNFHKKGAVSDIPTHKRSRLGSDIYKNSPFVVRKPMIPKLFEGKVESI